MRKSTPPAWMAEHEARYVRKFLKWDCGSRTNKIDDVSEQIVLLIEEPMSADYEKPFSAIASRPLQIYLSGRLRTCAP